MLSYDLWGHVARSATKDLEPLLVTNDDREPVVDQLDHSASLFDEHVVQLDVSVHYVIAVEVCSGFCDLLENSPSSGLSDDAVRQTFRVLLQRDALDVVSDDVYLLCGVDEVVQPDH